jgi:hypothetical protein
MAEQINLNTAHAVMEEAVRASNDPARLSSAEFTQWAHWILKFSELCAEKNVKTYIAVLGNALLAKASNPRVDVCSLKARDDAGGAYDARRSAEKVLVPASQIHRFSLGVTGPQPLNNQPFFRVYRITRELPVKPHLKPVLDELLRLLHEIQQYRTEEAVRALAAFVDVRREYVAKYTVQRGSLGISSGAQLAEAIGALVSQESEGGSRAQASVGGLLDALYSVQRVRVGKRNEPDRQLPGDVCIRATSDSTSPYIRVFEVRDKNVPPHAVLAFIAKVASSGIGRAALVAIAGDQGALDTTQLEDRARQDGVDLQIFAKWTALVDAVMFAADLRELPLVESAVVAIRQRLIALEVSQQAVQQWDHLTLRGALSDE